MEKVTLENLLGKSLLDKISRVDENKLEHLKFVLNSLIECYFDEEKMAAIILKLARSERTSLVGINANPDEVHEIVAISMAAIDASTKSQGSSFLN